MNVALDTLLAQGAVWQGRRARSPDATPTGHRVLDDHLPGGGWPAGALIELLPEHPGIGELELLLPTLTACGAQAWVAPPHHPHAPALAAAGLDLSQLLIVRPADPGDALWAIEQCLGAGYCVLGWPTQASATALRRLQLAADSGRGRAFVFRPAGARRDASPAALRLLLSRPGRALAVRILKCRGGQPAAFTLPVSPDAVAMRRPASAPAGCSERACA